MFTLWKWSKAKHGTIFSDAIPSTLILINFDLKKAQQIIIVRGPRVYTI